MSFGGDCASPTLPVIYSRISKAYDWIADEVCAYDSNKAERAGFNCPPVSTWMPTASPIFTPSPTFTPTTQRQCDVLTTCANIGLEGMCCSAWGVSFHTFLHTYLFFDHHELIAFSFQFFIPHSIVETQKATVVNAV